MLEGDQRKDSLFEMIDKLHVMNLSMEGAAILKSMADSIQGALEKGLLLEQLIVNERNNSVKEPQKSKKRKRKHSLCSNESLTEINEPESLPFIDLKKETVPTLDQAESLKRAVEKYVNKTKPLSGRIKIIQNVSPKKSVITLKDQASLLISNSNSCINDNKSKNIKQNHPVKHTSKPAVQDHLSGEKNPNLITAQALHLKSDHSTYPNVIPEIALVPSVNSYNGTITETQQEPISRLLAEVPPLINTFVSSDFSISKTTSLTPINKEPLNNECQPLLMPSPIKIKSEFKTAPKGDDHPKTDMFIPFNSMSNVTQPSQTPNLDVIAESPETIHPNPHPIDTSAKGNEGQNHCQQPKHQVYIEAVKDLREEEIISIFKDLDVIHCRIINKLNYSFGFISFSSKEDMDKALTLNGKFFIRGKVLFIRECHEYRKKKKSQPKPPRPQQPIHPQKKLKKGPQFKRNSKNKKKKGSK